MLKNLDFEILKEAHARCQELMDRDGVSIQKLALKLHLDEHQLFGTVVSMEKGGLLRMGGVIGGATISAITPSGREVLERLENNKFRNKLKNWFLVGLGALLLKVIETVTPHLLRGLE